MKMTMILAALAAMAANAAEVRTIDGNEWQDMSRMSLGREETRASFAPFESPAAALDILPWKSSRQICLDSDTAWKFKWSKSPAFRPVGFELPEYDVSRWETIKVPCSWQAYGANGKGGWGTALYTNVGYPFAVNPPRVMDDPPRHFTNYDARNPVGSYRRDFEVPASWKGDRVFLKFDGVDSFYYLWVNGKYVGFTKDSRCAAEYDVTDFVKTGKNTVALEVYRYSDGAYLEDQDMFRLSGIFRSAWLVRRPQVRIRDFFARAKPKTDGDYAGDWRLSVEVDLAGVGRANVDVSLYTLDGRKVSLTPVVGINFAGHGGVFAVVKPKLWSPETPNCYKLVLTLVQGKKTLESVSTLFGFRESKIINGRYCLNGQKVKLHGADRHETDPMFGHYCPHERQEEDVRLLKRANCNLVRNSHYPQDDYWYYLCDLNGIALMDEANNETHGYPHGATNPMFRLPMVWRNMNMVERNKNHPSVLFWSHGNECGRGDNFKACSEAVHARDWSRPTHYEGDWSNSDIDSNMYPNVDTVKGHARDTNAKRPYFMCEYAHNMMNAMGNLKDYQDAVESSDVCIGGCIWDWVDQGLYREKSVHRGAMDLLGGGRSVTDVDKEKGVRRSATDKSNLIIAYGGDFGDQPNDGQFVMNGCILSDRQLEPAYWEIKHVYQPAAVLAQDDGRSVKVVNKQFFRGLDVYDISWKVLVNGKETAKGVLNLDAVGPRGEKVVPLPQEALSSVGPGKSVSVRYQFACREKDGFLEKGYVIADDQIDLANEARAVPLAVRGGASFKDSNGRRTFTAGDATAAFDIATGALVSYRVKGVERLLAPMSLDAYRAPSSNELGPAGKWSLCGWRNFKTRAVSFGEVKKNGDALDFLVETEHVGAAKEELHSYGRTNTRIENKGEISKTAAPTFRAVQRWRVYGDGTITCQSEIRPQGIRRELPRIGWHFVLPLDFAKVQWFGRGPFENYRDRKSGAFRGLWTSDLTKFVMPYARPEDANNFEDTDAVTLGGAKGAIGFATLGAPFAFEAIPYSPTEIIETMHPVELPKPSKVELGLFAETRGLGGASCGPPPLKRDIIETDRNYRLDFAILPRPVATALSAPDANLPPAPPHKTGFEKWKLVSTTSEHGGRVERASNVCDGDPDTFWHTRYGDNAPSYPHSVVCDYGEVRNIKGIIAVPRQDMSNGRVKRYRIETSADAKGWSVAAEGELRNTDDLSEIYFKTPVKARYMRFTALSPHHGNEKWATMAELQPILE